MILRGRSMAGDSVSRTRVENDYYATPEIATISLLKREEIIYPAWECACGEGHIAKLLTGKVVASDLINRGYGEVADFLSSDSKSCATIITNPPFSLFQEFAERALSIA